MFAFDRRKQHIRALYPHGESEGLYGAFGKKGAASFDFSIIETAAFFTVEWV